MALWKARGGNRLPGGSRVEGKRTRFQIMVLWKARGEV